MAGAPLRQPLLGAVLVAVTLVGCGSDDPPTARNKPEDALRGFYQGVVRDRDARAACRYAAPGFELRPTNVVAGNIDGDDPLPQTPTAKYRSEPRRGPCPKLVARVVAARSAAYPWNAFRVESVKVARDGRSADAVTLDGSSGLRLVDGEWRVAWVNDSQ